MYLAFLLQMIIHQNRFYFNFQYCALQQDLYIISKKKSPLSMSQSTQRTHKFLALAGDEGRSLEARDFKKIKEQIVQKYLKQSKSTYEEFLLNILPKVIRRIPLKQHIYAGLVAEIRKVKPQLSLSLVRAIAANLQTDINSLKLHQSYNGIIFFSELMNIEKLNSQCFFDIIDDIVVYLQNCKNQNHRLFFVNLYTKSLHNYAHSLNKKVYYEFKKQLDRVKKYCGKSIQFSVIYEAAQKGNILDGSNVLRLYGQIEKPQSADQIQQNIKLKINVKQEQKYLPIQYFLALPKQTDKLYQQFHKNEGPLHSTNIELIVQLMKQNANYMIIKIKNYIKNQGQCQGQGENENGTFLQRFCIEFILGKGMKSLNTAVQSFILLKLVQENRKYAQIIQKSLQQGFVFSNQNYDLSCQMKFAQIITYLANNWPTGKNDMTDISMWDWDKITNPQQDPLNETFLFKKNVLLRVITEKSQLLNEEFIAPNCLSKFTIPSDPRTPAKYKLPEQLEKQQAFRSLLSRKSVSDQIIPSILSENDYEIFLQCLFQNTSKSHTHLQILVNRYSGIFQAFKQQYDWTLLNVIRTNWEKSLFHRLLYIQTVIEKGFVDFDSYVKYIAKVQTKNEEEAQMVKMQLSQLHKLFSEKLAK